MKEGEFQNCRPTHQSVGCEEAVWGSGAVRPNFNYLREKRHGWRFIREHNILESRMLLQLSQINNWPCHTENVPHTVYIGTKAHRFCWKYCCSLLLWSVIYLCIPVVHEELVMVALSKATKCKKPASSVCSCIRWTKSSAHCLCFRLLVGKSHCKFSSASIPNNLIHPAFHQSRHRSLAAWVKLTS